MTFGLAPGKLGFKIGEVLVGLSSGTTDTPETISSTQNKLHTLGYVWNPDTLAYEVPVQGLTDTELRASAVPTSTAEYATQLDDNGAGTTYVGTALPGSSTAAAVWKIKRLAASGADLSITFADGDADFDNVWDNRAALAYT